MVAALSADGRVGVPVAVSRGFGTSPRWLDDGTLLWADRAGIVMSSRVSATLDVSAAVKRADLSELVGRPAEFAVLPGGDLLVTQKGEGEGEIRHFEIVLDFEPVLRRLIAKANGGR